jgi:hypothetical protein
MQLAEFIHQSQPRRPWFVVGSKMTVVAKCDNECAVNVVNPVSGAVDAYHITGNEVELCWNDELFPLRGINHHIVGDKGWVRYVVATFNTEDGYTFYRLHDDSVVDSLDPESVDMSWPSYQSFADEVGAAFREESSNV